jgi:hypothetical protein
MIGGHANTHLMARYRRGAPRALRDAVVSAISALWRTRRTGRPLLPSRAAPSLAVASAMLRAQRP